MMLCPLCVQVCSSACVVLVAAAGAAAPMRLAAAVAAYQIRRQTRSATVRTA